MSSSHKKGQPAMLKPRPLGLSQGLAELYMEELLCDATLVADGHRFPCHRALLAAISPYFRDIFISTWEESNGKEVLLKDVAPSVVESILKYIYTEEIALTLDLAPCLFAGASQLQIVPLQNICCRFLVMNLSVQNCFETYRLAHAHKNRALLYAVIQLLIKNFDRVFEEREFLHLELSTLVTLISSSDLAVASEFSVYQAVRRWVQGQPGKRNPLLRELMQHVRLPLLSLEEQDKLQSDLDQWTDLKLEWELLDGEERLRQSRGLRQGMYKPHILCVDTQMCEYQELEAEEAHMGCYDPQAELWEMLPGLHSLTHACCASAGDKIYVSGGAYRNSYSTAVYEFSSFNSQWLELPSMDVPRAAHGFLFHSQKLFAVGGWCKFQSFLNLAECFDFGTGEWAPMAKLPFALSHPASSVFRNKLYFLGGATGISSHWLFHRGFLIYEVSCDTWTRVPLATGFFAAGAVAMDNGICVVGGYSEKKTRDWVDGALVPENRHSSRRCIFVNEAGKVSHGIVTPKLPRGIANAGVVRCGKRIYVLGGEDLTQRYKTIYHWAPGEPRWHRSTAEMPVPREGISRFGCVTLMRPKAHILQLFQVASLVPVAVISK
ncbi:kelch-like protein 3 [Elgaria multicarinata webbii]|uniref:kelch-like protein 3 n=1 Tax=Elgaria multicarinata webbii TaxID=159646 RepID=UPI002FCD2E60